MKELYLAFIIVIIASTSADEYGQEKRRHIKLNFGIHVPPIVLKLPRVNVPQVTIKANFLKQPNAKPLEVNLPPPPQISFGTDEHYGGGGYGGGGGGYGGGHEYGGGYGGYGSADTQKAVKVSQDNRPYSAGPPNPQPGPYGPPSGPPGGGYEGGPYGYPPPPPPHGGPPPGAYGPPPPEDYRRAYNAAPMEEGYARPPVMPPQSSQYSPRIGVASSAPYEEYRKSDMNRFGAYEKSAYYN